MRAIGVVAAVLACVGAGCGMDTTMSTDTGVDIGSDAGIDAAPVISDGGTDAPVAPDAGPPDSGSEPCTTPGVTEMVPCGMCGSTSRFCAASGFWVYGGACTGEHACMPGTMRTAPCGMCGTHTERCTVTCDWDTHDACTGETGTCVPGVTARTSSDCPTGQSRLATCDATCTEVGGVCEAAVCTPGDSTRAACGFCGEQVQTCDAFGQWVDGTCIGSGACMPGASESATCMACGTQMRTCNTMCQWDVSACIGGVACPPMPAASCVDAMTLRRYDPTTVCLSGACAYTSTTVPCPGGCSMGVCSGPDVLRHDLGGPNGFGTGVVPAGDDTSSSAIDLTSLGGLNLYGGTMGPHYTVVYVNNNGNVSFAGPLTTYTPMFPTAMGGPLIAPFWADVDTRAPSPAMTNIVAYAVSGTTFAATWYRVGYFAMHTDKLDSFQMILTARPDVAPGDFDVELRYQDCNWTTGDASGGTMGLGGMMASAGFSSGDATMQSLVLPGSGTSAVLNLCSTSNVGMPGIWRYQVRGGIPM